MNAWERLKQALKNEEACDRYSHGYREEKKEKSEMEVACEALKKAAGKQGIVLALRLA